MARLRRIVRVVVGLLLFLAYAWVAAVRLLPEIKRRKALRRGRPRRAA